MQEGVRDSAEKELRGKETERPGWGWGQCLWIKDLETFVNSNLYQHLVMRHSLVKSLQLCNS